MARSILSAGMLTALAASIAVRRRGLPPGSPPPALAATVISRIALVQEAPRFWSAIAFLRLICFHLLWPAIPLPRRILSRKYCRNPLSSALYRHRDRRRWMLAGIRPLTP